MLEDSPISSSAHEFAFYIDQLSSQAPLTEGQLYVCDNESVVRRLIQVLRLRPGQSCILFDRYVSVKYVIQEVVGKKSIRGVISKKLYNVELHPQVTYILPLLKGDSLDRALYSLAEVGVTTIQLVKTDKVQRVWARKDMDRAQRILVSAAEQSKYFALPHLLPPIPFDQMIMQYMGASVTKLYCDASGAPILDVLNNREDGADHIIVMVGPEGDLTHEEKLQLKKHQVIFVALTPTVLRACQAIFLSAGIVRLVY